MSGRIPTTDAPLPKPKYVLTWRDDEDVEWAFDGERTFVIEAECYPENGEFMERGEIMDFMVDEGYIEEGGKAHRKLARKLEAIG